MESPGYKYTFMREDGQPVTILGATIESTIRIARDHYAKDIDVSTIVPISGLTLIEIYN